MSASDGTFESDSRCESTKLSEQDRLETCQKRYFNDARFANLCCVIICGSVSQVCKLMGTIDPNSSEGSPQLTWATVWIHSLLRHNTAFMWQNDKLLSFRKHSLQVVPSQSGCICNPVGPAARSCGQQKDND